jgi:GMP synthase-like glutamine amidotransferase
VSGGERPVRALVIQQEAASPGGLVLDWLEGHSIETDIVRIDARHDDIDLRGYDLLIPLGSEFAPYHDHIPWIPRQAQLLRDAHVAGTSVLGICFGGQLLAQALGARCYRAGKAEIGWLPVRSHDPGFVSDGPWFQWHFDTFEPPAGANLIASSDAGPQAYVIGQSMGLQFHPEVTPQIMEDWVRVYRHELDAEGVDPDAVLRETYQRAATSAEMSRRLLDVFLERVAKLPGGR